MKIISNGKELVLPIGGVTVAGSGVPKGAIIMWSGSKDTVPEGWHICDGTEGTVDLRDQFVVGAGQSYSLGDTGGEKEVTLTIEQMPQHRHKVTRNSSGSTGTTSGLLAPSSAGSTSGYSTDYVGEDKPHNNLPPYYALYYIQKIKDEPVYSGGSASSEDIYSTEETVIGKWIDGKPLYRKVFTGMCGSKAGWNYIPGTEIPDVDLVPFIDACFVIADRSYIQLPYGDGYSFIAVEYNTTSLESGMGTGINVYFYGSAVTPANKPIVIVLEYTKTTD